MPSSEIRLTTQQQAIVNHDLGPALVYAVAGAGKTTAMVHRIARLVQQGIFPARQILATSFNRDANQQIQQALTRWPQCADVRVRTLHALGYTVIKMASERGYMPGFDLSVAGRSIASADRKILNRTLETLRRKQSPLSRYVESIDYDDFLAFVQRSKAALAFPNRPSGLSWRVRRTLKTPEPPSARPWYLDLYAEYEAMRVADGLLTFDDMLSTGWELLARHPDLLDSMQKRHRSVLVDEFQDVNRAQAEILDLLTRPGRNYMVIGDDDQTIYEWRGASPFFIRGFRKRYRSTQVYFMTDNFRSRATHLALANAIIQRDAARQPKYLQLTRGFAGECVVSRPRDEGSTAEEIARTALMLHAKGVAYAAMAVLVRIYHQTNEIERCFRRAGIPYTVLSESDSSRRTIRGVTLTSIFRAKGLEWQAVFLPGCSDGMLPYRQAHSLEEERRLFYVGITRAKESLYLYAQQDRPISPFLEAAGYQAVLASVDAVADALSRSPVGWSMDDYVAIAVNAKRLYLHEYLAHWWSPPPAFRRQVAEAVLRFYATLKQLRLFRALKLDKSDVVLWRSVARSPVNESVLTDPDLLTALGEMTSRAIR